MTLPSWWVRDALCVHSHEGAWNSATGNGYYGGMQMDVNFMATYGADFEHRYGGYANVWPPKAQLVASYRAWRTLGWRPWPNTAAMCGLL